MKKAMVMLSVLVCVFLLVGCNLPDQEISQGAQPEISGAYCLNVMNLELYFAQDGENLVFTTSSNTLQNGSGTISGSQMQLNAQTAGGETFSASVALSDDRAAFQGTFAVLNQEMEQSVGGVLLGFAGSCPVFDLEVDPLPQFVTHDFINLENIEQISKFRSGFGHSFTDGFETCRSMKHYYNPYPDLRENQRIEIYAPVSGTILSILEDGHGASLGLNNKQIHLRPEAQPAFTIELYHVDLISEDMVVGRQVDAGELLGYAHLYYPDLDEHATSVDIAVRVNTPDGSRLLSFFDVMAEPVFERYASRGVLDRQAFILSQQERDAAPLECSGERFLSEGELENWVALP